MGQGARQSNDVISFLGSNQKEDAFAGAETVGRSKRRGWTWVKILAFFAFQVAKNHVERLNCCEWP